MIEDNLLLENLLKIDSEESVIGCFCIGLLSKPLFGTELWEPHPLHDGFVRPLLAIAESCKVYSGISPHQGNPLPTDELEEVSLSKKGGVFSLDLTKELIHGREYLWNAANRKRGSIVITIADRNALDLEIFRFGTKPFVWASVFQMQKSHNKAALTFGAKQAASNKVVFAFSASNGLDRVDILAPIVFAEVLYHDVHRLGWDPYEFRVQHSSFYTGIDRATGKPCQLVSDHSNED